MSNRPFNPKAFKVEDLFRAKEERRRHLAKLPFEQKIEILRRLQQVPIAARQNEKLIFASFLEFHAELNNEIAEWHVVEEWYPKRTTDSPDPPFDKRPDIIAATKSGKKIGIELKSWVNRAQITKARKQERIQDQILNAIGELPPNDTQHLDCVWLCPKQVRFDQREAEDFRKQMFKLIEEVDADEWWSLRPTSAKDLLTDRGDLVRFPTLEKYLRTLRFRPAVEKGRSRRHWILFPSPAGFYSPSEMRETLKAALLNHRSEPRYKDLKVRVDLDEVYLLVHYDFKAFAYNTHFSAPDFGFKEAASFASEALNGDGGYFDRIFLFHFLWGQEDAYQIFPELQSLSQR